MLKGIIFTVGVLATLGGFGWGALTVLAGSMSDNPNDNEGALRNAVPSLILFGAGAAVMLGAWFVP